MLIGCATGNLIRINPETCLQNHNLSAKGVISGTEMVFIPPHIRRKLLEEEKERPRKMSMSKRLSTVSHKGGGGGGGGTLGASGILGASGTLAASGRKMSTTQRRKSSDPMMDSFYLSATASKMVVEDGFEGAFRCMLLHGDGLYAGGVDGTLRLFKISGYSSSSSSKPEVSVEPVAHLDYAVSSLSSSRDFVNLLVGSAEGSVRFFSTKNKMLSAEPIIHSSASTSTASSSSSSSSSHDDDDKYISLGILAQPELKNNQTLVAVRSSGAVIIIDGASGEIKSASNDLFFSSEQIDSTSSSSKQPPSSSSSSAVLHAVSAPTCPLLAASTTDGFLVIVDLSDSIHPRVVRRVKLTHDAARGFHLAFDPTGVILATGGADGHVYLINAAPSSGFDVLGCLNLGSERPFEFTTLTAFYNIDNKKIKIAGLLASQEDNPAKISTKLFSIEFSSTIARDPSTFHSTESKDFNGALMNKMLVDLQHPAEGLALVNPATAFTFACGHLVRFRLPLTAPAARGGKNGAFVIPFEEMLSGHAVGGVGGGRSKVGVTQGLRN